MKLNPNLIELETKENFYKLLEWLYLKISVVIDNKIVYEKQAISN